ncbi:hypothetical protein BB560_005142 [Smittium megazygosporum]|uniref:Cytochrome P450 n=1 Tax=Smittium megazygosporum TaxID=133381 RepID=A0A2T9Z7A0_9FUNG|nr:hypothetical protein BB560_005142 [Smittium megazygosporum]
MLLNGPPPIVETAFGPDNSQNRSNTVKNIFKQFRKNPSPVLMKNYELSSNSNLLEYLDEFKKADYVSKFIGSKSDFNLGKTHLKLFSGLPESIFSKKKVSKMTFYKDWSYKKYLEAKDLNSILRALVYTNAPNSLSEIEYIIHQNLSRNSDLSIENNYVLIESFSDYVNMILVDIGIRQCYGGAAKSDTEFCNAVELLLNQPLSFGEKNISHLLKFRLINRKSNYERGRDYIRDFVLTGKFKQLNKNSLDENECLASLLLKKQKELGFPNDIFYTSLPGYFCLFVTLVGHPLSNFFIDISLNPSVFKKLENEQRKLIAKYGNVLTTKQLEKMVYLDAAITETLRFSTNNLSMKLSLCDIYLPNGVLLPKGSFTKFNIITHNRSSDVFLNHPHDYIPERHFILGTKLDVTSKTNLAWGLERQCSYKKYASLFMKLFIASVIRKYEVSQKNKNNKAEHGGIYDFKT